MVSPQTPGVCYQHMVFWEFLKCMLHFGTLMISSLEIENSRPFGWVTMLVRKPQLTKSWTSSQVMLRNWTLWVEWHVYIYYWPSARSVRENIAQVHFLRVYGPSRFGEVHKHVKSEREQYSSVRTECEVNKWFIIWRNQQNSDLMWAWSIVNFSCVCQRL